MDSLRAHVGELAALGAALCWVFTTLAFAAAGRRIGPTAVNMIRTLVALAVLAVVSRLLFGHWLPPVAVGSVTLLAISGLIGLAIGDQLLFTALVDVGPRLSVLLMTIAPPVTAVIAWPVLDEPLGLAAMLGIAVTLAGIAWVVLERPEGATSARVPHRRRGRGIVFGLVAGVCQAIGLVLAKLGMGHVPGAAAAPVDPWTATLYRMAAAAAGVTLLVVAQRRVGKRRAARSIEISAESEHLPMRGPGRLPFALAMVMVGVVFGPVLGVWCSMVAVDRTEAGIAATLMATTPVMILPFAVWIERERLSWRAAIGAAVAVAGVGILALTNGHGRP